MHEVAQFLRAHAPFDVAGDDELEAVAEAVEIEFHVKGSVVLAAGDDPGGVVHVVRRGALAVLDGERVLDVLGEGEVVGHPSMLIGEPASGTIRAEEDAITYRVPFAVLEPLLTRPEGLRWVARSLRGREARHGDSQSVGMPSVHFLDSPALPTLEPGGRPVAALVRPALLLQPTDSVGEAARRMAEAGASCVLVALGQGVGILTDRDLRERVLAVGRGPEMPVGEAMTAPARAVAGDRVVEDVLLELLDLGVRHAPVVDRDGAVLGVVSDLDLLAGGPLAPFVVRRRIERAHDRDAVVAAAAGFAETSLALHEARMDAVRVAEIESALRDALVRRLLALAEADLGAPPVPYGWYALGSHGRREVAPSSDADSALVWEGEDRDPALRAYFHALASRVVDDLDAAGVARCASGATADRPLFARSVDAWVAGVRALPAAKEEQALILLAAVADARPLTAADPGGGLVGAALREPDARPEVERRLASMALASRPPTGFVRELVVEHSGARAGTLDLKRGGLLPIVDLARALALRAGHRPVSTPGRLAAARDAGLLGAEDAGVLEAAFELLMDLRLGHQVRQLRAGARPDDHLAPASLDALTRAFLRDAFRAVARVQRGIAAEFRLRPP